MKDPLLAPSMGRQRLRSWGGRRCVLVNTTRAAARHDLDDRAFVALEKHFMDELEDMQASATAVRQGPKPLPGPP